MKHTKRISIIIGSYPQFTNLDWYTSKLVSATGYINNRIKIKKNFMYEQDYKSRALTIHVTETKRNEIDKKLQQISIANIDNIKYILFKNVLSNKNSKLTY